MRGGYRHVFWPVPLPRLAARFDRWVGPYVPGPRLTVYALLRRSGLLRFERVRR